MSDGALARAIAGAVPHCSKLRWIGQFGPDRDTQLSFQPPPFSAESNRVLKQDKSAFVESTMDISSHSYRVSHVVRYAIAMRTWSVIALAHTIFRNQSVSLLWTEMHPLERVLVF